MSDPINALIREGIIDEVISRLKSGKEADIYLVQHAGEIVAAKVYKERHARSFHNNSAYKEGRVIGNSRTQRAMAKGSRFGRKAEEEAWKEKESEVLHMLFDAGVRVPKPVLFYDGILLMEVVLDPQGFPAPRLVDARISREHAVAHYVDLRQQMVKMLARDLIHGDLSPYNVLLAWNGPTLIDFPQVVGAAHNSQAMSFFMRDFQTLWRFFFAIDPSLQSSRGDGEEIWRAYTRRELTQDFVPTGHGVPAASSTGGTRGHRQGKHKRDPQARKGGGQPALPQEPGRRDPRRQTSGDRPRSVGPGRNQRSGQQAPIVSYVGQTPAPAPESHSAQRSASDVPASGKGNAAAGESGRRRRRRRSGRVRRRQRGVPPTQ